MLKQTQEEQQRAEKQAVLEKEFLTAAKKAVKQIRAQLVVANKAVQKAEEISEKYGIPFNPASVAPEGFFTAYTEHFSSVFTPESFDEKFGDLDLDFLYNDEELTDCTPGQYGPGWEHSQVC